MNHIKLGFNYYYFNNKLNLRYTNVYMVLYYPEINTTNNKHITNTYVFISILPKIIIYCKWGFFLDYFF